MVNPRRADTEDVRIGGWWPPYVDLPRSTSFRKCTGGPKRRLRRDRKWTNKGSNSTDGAARTEASTSDCDLVLTEDQRGDFFHKCMIKNHDKHLYFKISCSKDTLP